MHIRHTLGWLVTAALLVTAGPPPSALAADGSQPSTSKARKPKAPKPPTDRGPAETRAERDKRLLRECRGRPNAGACEGYAN